MALQQYLFRPRESMTFPLSSPFFVFSTNSPQNWAIGFPHDMQRIGIIILFKNYVLILFLKLSDFFKIKAKKKAYLKSQILLDSK